MHLSYEVFRIRFRIGFMILWIDCAINYAISIKSFDASTSILTKVISDYQNSGVTLKPKS